VQPSSARLPEKQPFAPHGANIICHNVWAPIVAALSRAVARAAMLRRRAMEGRIRMQACGVILLVQEHRFELLADDGGRRHFTLAHDAPLGWHELQQLQRDACRVLVRHDATLAGRSSAAAHSIARLPPVRSAPALA
jgi:hypothetical protein